METNKRSLVKTISFRIVATIATMIIILILTGSLVLMGIVAGIDLLSKSIIYYIHERVWDKISWGKRL